jgi:DNA polymerase III subunit alpha
MFTHLHVHSEYSLLESSIKIKDLIDAACKLNMKAMALTDKYVMSGAVEFYKEAVSKNIKPVIGCEICFSHNNILSHLTLLAKDEKGYGNLCGIVSKSHLETDHHMPLVKIHDLKNMAEGLICLSGCSKSVISFMLKNQKINEAMETACMLNECFEGDFYIEIQR